MFTPSPIVTDGQVGDEGWGFISLSLSLGGVVGELRKRALALRRERLATRVLTSSRRRSSCVFSGRRRRRRERPSNICFIVFQSSVRPSGLHCCAAASKDSVRRVRHEREDGVDEPHTQDGTYGRRVLSSWNEKGMW